MVSWLLEALQAAARWILDWFADRTEWALDLLATGLDALLVALGVPGGVNAFDLSGVAPYLSAANQWLPLDTAAAVLVGYWLFLVVFVGLKMTLKLIPTVG
ncbi:MAG: hypothetical protein AAGG01_00820 [Planctomycetota bacterium]